MTKQPFPGIERLRIAVASRAVDVSSVAAEQGLDLPLVTIIARHPNNDKMYIVVSNDELLAEPIELMMQFRQGEGEQ